MVLVLGSSGYVGSKICQYLRFQEIPFTTFTLRFDISRIDKFDHICRTKHISSIINCSGFNGEKSIDDCEANVQKTEDANVICVWQIVDICKKYRIPLLHVSTGCIYDGDQNWSESDDPNYSTSVYNRTKIEAEQIVSTYANSYICRLRLPFDYMDNPKNLLSKMIKFTEITDHYNSITNLNDFAQISVELIKEKKPFGIYNIVNSGKISFLDIKNILSGFNVGAKPFRVLTPDEERVKFQIPRSNTTLNNVKVTHEGFILDDVRDSIMKCLNNWNNINTDIFW